MKYARWISLMLMAVMMLSMVCGCQKQQAEEEAAADNWVESEKEEIKEPDKDTTPTDKEQNGEQKDQNNTPSKEEQTDDMPTQEKPSEDPPAQETPGEEDTPNQEPSKDDEPSSGEEEPEPIEKESSGTPITFLMQNLRTSGNQKGTKEERTGGDLNLYHRARRFKTMVQTQDPDVILGQEGTPGWLNYFETDDYFSYNYKVIWQYRCPGSNVEMSSPVLYKKAKYDLMDSGYFWLSDTPHLPSISYGAGVGETHYRISSWVKLRDKSTGAVFYAYSTHFDVSDTAHYKSMRQYLDLFDEMNAEDYAFVGGDFNFKYRSDPYLVAVDWEKQVDLQDMAFNMQQDGLAEIGGANGSLHTHYAGEAFQPGVFPDPNPGAGKQLDHIFAKLNPHMAVDYWGFDYTDYDYPPDQVSAGFISDHYGLICKVRIGATPDYSQYQVRH